MKLKLIVSMLALTMLTACANRSEIYKAVSQAMQLAITSIDKPAVDCDPLGDRAIELTEKGEEAYFDSVKECYRSNGTVRTVAAAQGNPTTPQGEVAQEYAGMTQEFEKQSTNRTKIISNAAQIGVGTGGLVLVTKEREKTNRSFANGAFENSGDTSIGSVNVDNTQAIGSNSNDPSSGAGGELAGGPATSTTSNTITGGSGSTILNFGSKSNIGIAADSARNQVGSVAPQQLEPSANGGVNVSSNVDQQPIIDENNDSELSNQPTVGSDNGVF